MRGSPLHQPLMHRVCHKVTHVKHTQISYKHRTCVTNHLSRGAQVIWGDRSMRLLLLLGGTWQLLSRPTTLVVGAATTPA